MKHLLIVAPAFRVIQVSIPHKPTNLGIWMRSLSHVNTWIPAFHHPLIQKSQFLLKLTHSVCGTFQGVFPVLPSQAHSHTPLAMRICVSLQPQRCRKTHGSIHSLQPLKSLYPQGCGYRVPLSQVGRRTFPSSVVTSVEDSEVEWNNSCNLYTSLYSPVAVSVAVLWGAGYWDQMSCYVHNHYQLLASRDCFWDSL